MIASRAVLGRLYDRQGIRGDQRRDGDHGNKTRGCITTGAFVMNKGGVVQADGQRPRPQVQAVMGLALLSVQCSVGKAALFVDGHAKGLPKQLPIAPGEGRSTSGGKDNNAVAQGR